MARALTGFEPVAREDAIAVLAGAGTTDSHLAEIAALLGDAPPALAWAAALARTMGWGSLRTRLERWQLPAALPWRADVARVLATLPAEDVALLAQLADCDASVAWDVLEAVVPEVSVDAVCRLADAGLLVQRLRSDVVTFAAPFAVRAVVRTGATSALWLAAWTERARSLPTYGPRAASTLAELAAAVPLAARALVQPASAARGLALWLAASDAIFFASALELDDPAFAVAVTTADATALAAGRARARLVAARALLERGQADQAGRLVDEALALAPDDELRADARRGKGWAMIAVTHLDAAHAAFEAARTTAPQDPRNQADSLAGLGVLALLRGDPATARARLDEALAIHVVMRDAPREGALRGMMELLPAVGDEDTAAELGAVAEHRARGQHWREALSLARLAIAARARGDASAAQRYLLEASAAALVSRMPAVELVRGLVDARRSARPIVVSTEGRSLTLPSGDAHDLTRHGPVRRVLWALAVVRRDHPGTATSTLDMVAAGWPGEKMKHDAANLRVYTTVRRLRGLGLSEALLTRDDGYLLDPAVPLVIEAE